jgi:glycosyltransferase involved in cell wall biosynthesis
VADLSCAMKTAIHIYPSPLRNESRILKITRSLKDLGIFERILVVGVWEPGLKEREPLDETRELVRLRRRWGQGGRGVLWKIVKTLEWSWQVLRFLRPLSVTCLNCRSLSVLPLCAWLKWRKKAILVYDVHELETETVTMRGFIRPLAKAVERALIPLADDVVTVSDSIGAWYRSTYQHPRVHVVRNVPYYAPYESVRSDALRRVLDIPADGIVFLYQGMLTRERGVQALLEIFAGLPGGDQHLVLVGEGELEAEIRRQAGIHPHIHHHPYVAPERVLAFSSGADVGVHLIENTCLNHYYCLPNKVYEYIMAGLPVIVRDFPDMAALVRTHDCGWLVSDDNESVGHLVASLTPARIAGKKAQVLRAREQLGWQHEEAILRGVYRERWS